LARTSTAAPACAACEGECLLEIRCWVFGQKSRRTLANTVRSPAMKRVRSSKSVGERSGDGLYGDVQPIDVPAYTLREATRLTDISFGTLRSWTVGKRPIIRPRDGFWSFTNIVEAHTLQALRKTHKVKLDAVRKAVEFVERKLETKHPLATAEFKTDGVDVFVERYGSLINASQEGQVAIREMLAARLKQVEYGRDGRATRLFMDGDRRMIVIDPEIRFGRPVVNGTSVPLEALVGRYLADEPVESIAEDFDLTPDMVVHALLTQLRTHAA